MSDRVCIKCGGAGWIWGKEFDEYDADTYNDSMTQYTCDWCKGVNPCAYCNDPATPWSLGRSAYVCFAHLSEEEQNELRNKLDTNDLDRWWNSLTLAQKRQIKLYQT